MTEPMPDQTPEPLQSDAALAELRARLAADGTLAPVPEELAPLCPVCLCGVVDDVVDLDDGSLIHGECMPVDVMIGQINTERDESARLRARITTLEAFVADIACHGLRADLNPTMDFGGGADRMYQQMVEYLRRIDRGLREVARSHLPNADRPHGAGRPMGETMPRPVAAEPHAYIAVKRRFSIHADQPEWEWDAAVIPAGHDHAWDRDDHKKRGYELLPIVGTETGTRPAAQQSDPAGYVVVTRNSEGGLHRSATAWDDLERATAAGGFQARHAEGTGCTAAVYELREVRGE